MSLDVNDSDSIKSFLKSCSEYPGIYKMFGVNDVLLYVGKAKNLKKRLSTYFNKNNQSAKVLSLVQQISYIETVITNTEAEALVLECNLIKENKPKYNILLRDDKSYPYICFSDHEFPRLFLYRGRKKPAGYCYGPYPNVLSAKETIRLLQSVFKIRTCTDNYYNNRTRPCLLYQIEKCTAPCVAEISKADYNLSYHYAKMFVEGKNKELIDIYVAKMQAASDNMDFEQAALVRDQIKKLQKIREDQVVEADVSVNKSINKAIDVIAWQKTKDYSVLVVLKFRQGKLIGSHEYISKINLDLSEENDQDDFVSVLSQYYINFAADKPDEVVINTKLTTNESNLLFDAINNKFKINYHPRGIKDKWLSLSLKNAEALLEKKTNINLKYLQQFESLAEMLNLDKMPNLIECIDVSHTFGKQTVASCVVFNHAGPKKNSYRRYNIDGTNGNDIAAIKQALTRRYKKILDNMDKKGEFSDYILPDILLIDGGKQQVNITKQVFADLNIDSVKIYGITKGEGRRSSNDRIICADSLVDVQIPIKSLAMHLLQSLRDEAHRFAIVGHRKKREQEQAHSLLQDVPGVGAKRRKALLSHFGGWQEVKLATIDKLAEVPGISKELAQKIHDYLH